jgi:hypothetical protein
MSRLLLGLALLAMFLAPATAMADDLTYESSWQVQNLEAQAGNLTIMFYGENGDVIPGATINDAIPVSGSKSYFAVQNLNLPTPFQGSAVIASDRELRVIHNLRLNRPGGALFAGASSAGYTHGSPELNLPLVMRNNGGYNTWFSVQNAGDADAEVTVEFFRGSHGNNYTAPPVTVKPGGAALFDQASTTQLGARFVGAVKIVSDGEPLVATLVQVGRSDMMAYDGFGMETELVAGITGDPTFIGPLFHYWNSNFWSGVQVQNVGDTATTVTLEFVPEAAPNSGTYCTETLTIQPFSSGSFGTYSFHQANHPLAGASTCYVNNPGTRFVGSVTVLANTANQPLNAIVNQVNHVNYKASSYSAFVPSEATQCIAAPLIMDRNSGYETGIMLYNNNVGSSTVDITYTRTTGAVSTQTLTVAGKTARAIYNANNLGNGWVGSAKICGRSASDKLLAIVNEIRHSEAGDSMYTYNGFNLD